jgi:hypothetical protein
MTASYEPTPAERRAQRAALGCFTSLAGFSGAAMIGVLVAKIVGTVRQCDPGEGLPACDWHVYAFGFGLVGLIAIPSLVFWRLRGSSRGARTD